MAPLPYLGAPQVNPHDVATDGYLTSLGGAGLTQTQITSQLTSGFSPYVLKSYVDAQNALNATASYVDAADATRLHLNQLGVANGIAPLDVTGKVPVANVNLLSTQRWPSPFYSPSAYNTANVVATGGASAGTPVQLYPISIADPGYTYKLLIFGQVDLSCSIDGLYPKVWVAQGATTGPIVGIAPGIGESYTPGFTSLFAPSGNYSHAIAAWANTVDLAAVGAGASGRKVAGAYGHAGVWATAALTRGSTMPTDGNLVITAGSGGAGTVVATSGANPGTASVVTGAGMTTVTAAGGVGAGTAAASSPGNKVFDGVTYPGGVIQTVAGGAGLAPGGGGNPSSSLGGGAGADGAVWVFEMAASPGIARGPAPVMSWPLNAQSALTGATTLYVMAQVASSVTPSPTITATTVRPGLWVMPIPA